MVDFDQEGSVQWEGNIC